MSILIRLLFISELALLLLAGAAYLAGAGVPHVPTVIVAGGGR